MLQQATIPKTPEDIAAYLRQMSEQEQCMVKGIIIGVIASRPTQPQNPEK